MRRIGRASFARLGMGSLLNYLTWFGHFPRREFFRQISGGLPLCRDMAQNNGIYEIYFMLQRQEDAKGTDLRLTVESAYPVIAPSPVRNRPNKIRFGVLALRFCEGKKIRFAAR